MQNINKIRILLVVILLLSFNVGVLLIPGGAADISILQNNENSIYYDYDDFTQLLSQWQLQYPEIFAYSSLGKTYELRDIWLVKISDNVSVAEDEPKVLYIGGVHGNEKPGYQVVIYSIKAILENYSTPNVNQSFSMKIKNIVHSTELFFIPMVNPDGVMKDCRKNLRSNSCICGNTVFRGVDINRNYGYKWEEFDRHPFKYAFGAWPISLRRTNIMFPFLDFESVVGLGNYRGPYPLSEPESKAVTQFIENQSIVIALDYHSTGELIAYPWSWTRDPPPDEPVFLSVAENISRMNGYRIVQSSYWYYIVGCLKDYIYDEHGIFPFTIELCPGNGSYAPSDQELVSHLCEIHLLVNLYVAERAQMIIK